MDIGVIQASPGSRQATSVISDLAAQGSRRHGRLILRTGAIGSFADRNVGVFSRPIRVGRPSASRVPVTVSCQRMAWSFSISLPCAAYGAAPIG
jgi:hypothetical protein